MENEANKHFLDTESGNRQSKRVFVEVGCGMIPVPALGTKDIFDDQIYRHNIPKNY